MIPIRANLKLISEALQIGSVNFNSCGPLYVGPILE